jgi:hypothetical protein
MKGKRGKKAPQLYQRIRWKFAEGSMEGSMGLCSRLKERHEKYKYKC